MLKACQALGLKAVLSVGYQIDRVWAGILLATLLTVATFVFVVAAERVVVARLQPETVA